MYYIYGDATSRIFIFSDSVTNVILVSLFVLILFKAKHFRKFQMVWNKYQCFVATSSFLMCGGNTLILKWSQREKAKASDGEVREFHHSFILTSFLFLGEMFNLLWFKLLYICLKRKNDGSEDRNKFTRGNHEFNPLPLAIPAFCELGSSATQFLGLHLTHPASYQMIKTSVIIFTAIFRTFFLKRKSNCREWTGIFIVIGGLGLVVLGDYVSPKVSSKEYKTHDIVIGDFLIFFGSLFTATQMVTEELFVSRKDLQPMEVIGWEGIFGFTIMLVLHIIFYFIPCPRPIANNSRQTLEDAIDGMIQISNSPVLKLLTFLHVFTIMICKVMGINLTKEFSSVTRRVFDSARVILLYAFSLIFFDQKFHYLHPLGFVIIVFGVLLHNNAINMNTARWIGKKCHCLKAEEEDEGNDAAQSEK